jgi:hypothetical protein
MEVGFDIPPLVAILVAESIGRRSWESGKAVPVWGNRCFEESWHERNWIAPISASSLQMGAFMDSGLCGEEIIVVHSQTHSIAADGQRLSCGCIEEVGAAVVDFVGETQAGVPLDGGVGGVGVDYY